MCSPGSSSHSPSTGLCGPGYLCPNGSLVATPCPAGQYCASSGLVNSTGPCMAGYLCRLQARDATPIDGVMGSRCPAGSYCPQGSGAATPCPIGTLNYATGSSLLTDCRACDSWSDCAGRAMYGWLLLCAQCPKCCARAKHECQCMHHRRVLSQRPCFASALPGWYLWQPRWLASSQ